MATALLSLPWTHREPLVGTPYTLWGHSRSAERASFYLPELNLQLDSGLALPKDPRVVLVTHGHTDHSCALSTNFIGWQPKESVFFDLVVPEDQKEVTADYLLAARRMFKANASRGMRPIKIYGAKPGDSFVFDSKVPVEVRTFECDHSISCLGYGLVEVRNKLKKEHLGKEGKELVRLKDAGEEITYREEHPHLAYLGDTSMRVFLNHPEILTYSTILMECTFLLPEDQVEARRKKHIHWLFLKPLIKGHPKCTFYLTHFSMKYTAEVIKDFFEKEENKLPNVHIWVDT